MDIVRNWKLVQLRDERELSQKKVARDIGLSESAYRKKEAGVTEFKASEMEKLSSYFGMSAQEIFFRQKMHETCN